MKLPTQSILWAGGYQEKRRLLNRYWTLSSACRGPASSFFLKKNWLWSKKLYYFSKPVLKYWPYLLDIQYRRRFGQVVTWFYNYGFSSPSSEARFCFVLGSGFFNALFRAKTRRCLYRQNPTGPRYLLPRQRYAFIGAGHRSRLTAGPLLRIYICRSVN